jgi:hypothetical protein
MINCYVFFMVYVPYVRSILFSNYGLYRFFPEFLDIADIQRRTLIQQGKKLHFR